jgi:hypothetical protein
MSNFTKNNYPGPADSAEFVSPESRHAWLIWKKLTDFSEILWDAYEHDFLTLAASEPAPKGYPRDDLPF